MRIMPGSIGILLGVKLCKRPYVRKEIRILELAHRPQLIKYVNLLEVKPILPYMEISRIQCSKEEHLGTTHRH